ADARANGARRRPLPRRRPYRLRASAKTARTASVIVKPTPVATGSATWRPASRATAASSTAPPTVGVAARTSAGSPRAALSAVTIAPVQARAVPSIHQIGKYHHVLPPPTASQVQG